MKTEEEIKERIKQEIQFGWKYVIKNCPANNTFWGCRGDKKLLKRHCKDITDCLLKRIVEVCKKGINSEDCYERMYGGKMYCQPVLKQLKIEEVDENRRRD